MKSVNSRRPCMEGLEQRQLMAADLALANEPLSLPVDQSANVLPQIAADDTSGPSFISNGLRPSAVRATLPGQQPSGDLNTVIIVEDSRPKDAAQLSQTLSADRLQVTVDRVFAEADTDSDSQLSEDEKEKWEGLIQEALQDFYERFEVRWQYVYGEGRLVTESFGPNEEWPI